MTLLPKRLSRRRIRETVPERIMIFGVYVILTLVILIVIYPLYVVIISSISDPQLVVLGKITLYPKGITLMGYEVLFRYEQLWISYRNTFFYTIIGTSLNILVTMMAAYATSRRFRLKAFVNFYFIFTMFFNGGLIPTFLTLRDIGLYNNMLVMILRGLITIWNMMVARTFIKSSIPEELYEAACLDGASHIRYFFSVIMPLSGTLVAVLCVYYAVAHWNNYFTGLVYLRDRNLLPLQTILREILASLQTSEDMLELALDDTNDKTEALMRAEVAKYGIVVVSTLPAVVLYLVMQKYFVKGIMIGSIKG